MFRKGKSGNPGGKIRNDYRKMLDLALAREAKKKGVSLVTHAVRVAYNDNTVLTAMVRKLLPDLKAVDMKVIQDSPFRLIIDMSPQPKKADGNSRKSKDDVKIGKAGKIGKK